MTAMGRRVLKKVLASRLKVSVFSCLNIVKILAQFSHTFSLQFAGAVQQTAHLIKTFFQSRATTNKGVRQRGKAGK